MARFKTWFVLLRKKRLVMGRQRLRHFNLMIFVSLALASLCVHAQDQSGFISIDCGLPEKSSYTDTVTGLNYVSDSSFIETGISKTVATESSIDRIDMQLRYLRSFPEGDRNCYNISISRNTNYLMRATFFYGNYDGLNKLPAFDLHLGVSKWVGVEILNASNPVIQELIHNTTTNYLYVCLVNIGFGTPFISALELRPLENTTYVTKFGSLAKRGRYNFGSATNQIVRYPADVWDRIWTPYRSSSEWIDISTTETVDPGVDYYLPPSSVMQTACIPRNESEPLNFSEDTQDTTLQLYFYLHFGEIVTLPNQSRIFNISLNGFFWFGPLQPPYLYAYTVFSRSAYVATGYRFSMIKDGNSTLPPLLNGIEIYYVVNISQSLTNQIDVNAITNIKSSYGIKRNWHGDPCAPLAYAWLGLVCSFDDDSPPTIKSLNLSSSELTGEIAPAIANLKSLEVLDLSNNNLSGPVPKFLSLLTSLKILKLNGNNFTGAIPAGLLERSKDGSLLLSIDEDLCQLDSCARTKKGNSVAVPVVASVVAVFVLLIFAGILLWWIRRKNKPDSQVEKVEAETNRKPEPLELKQRQFSYLEVLKMTNNFEHILGKGSFGSVYYGYLGDTQVAVKMLSPSSFQGYKEFHAEVKLLLRVHHRNLTNLVGYCDEGTNVGLIYEYMAKGNLQNHLSGGNRDVINWEARLRIAVEAAQGLEYLHHGCKPPIIHRDVKSTNILLNDKFEAKLSDFGLSRTSPVEGRTHVSTKVAGTPGYLDPEYYVTNWLTEKSDVYSFGVVLLEIITSRPVIAKNREKTHISQWVQSILETGDVQSIVDPRLQADFDVNSVWKIVELATSCVSPTSARRPTMNQVVIELNECLTAELSRKREGYSYPTGSTGSTESMSAYVHTGLSPLVR